ncbi:MAG: cardiolipin synthase [Myxococcales bacterium]|nr:cardiolipin synthase [Myxococcales bacterium]
MKSFFVIATLLVAACQSDPAASADATIAIDAPDGTGCTPTTPRSQVPDTFVGPTGLQTRLGNLIDGAHTTLDVQMYLFTVQALANKIVAAKNRGVAVRVILDPDEAGNQSVIPIFNSGAIAWKNASTVYTFSHAKYLLIDHASVVIMSMNFNVDAMNNERNYGFVDRDLEDVADVQSVFEQDWALANGMQAAAPNLSCTRLIISPVNSTQRILTFINGAHQTLDLEVLYVSDVNVRNAIGAAKQRGVTVRVILEDPSDQAGNAATTTYLKNLGIPVKYVTTQFYNHAKLIIADGTALVGSQNMSPTSLTQNREIAGLIFEPSALVPIQQQFDADWTATTPAP